MTKNLIPEIVGWLSIVGILVGYLLITFGFITPNTIIYQGINLVSSLGIVVTSYPKKNYPVVALNMVWFIAALISIFLILF